MFRLIVSLALCLQGSAFMPSNRAMPTRQAVQVRKRAPSHVTSQPGRTAKNGTSKKPLRTRAAGTPPRVDHRRGPPTAAGDHVHRTGTRHDLPLQPLGRCPRLCRHCNSVAANAPTSPPHHLPITILIGRRLGLDHADREPRHHTPAALEPRGENLRSRAAMRRHRRAFSLLAVCSSTCTPQPPPLSLGRTSLCPDRRARHRSRPTRSRHQPQNMEDPWQPDAVATVFMDAAKAE